MDFETDIRRHVMSYLPHTPGQVAELMAMRVDSLLIVYRNWLGRLVPEQPRRVHRSQALLANPRSWDANVSQLIAKIECGAPLRPHLSQNIDVGYDRARSGRRGRRHLDLLLNDWGVHHLHLSSQVQPNGFVKRGGPLLFVAFKPEDAYLIDIMGHGDWTRHRIMEVMAREWPDAELVVKLKGAKPGGRPLSESDRKVLRNKHTNAFFEIDGDLYTPRTLGISSAGTSSVSTIFAHRLLKTADLFHSEISNDDTKVREALASNNLPLPTQLDLHFAFRDNGAYGVLETQTRAFMQLGVW